MTIDFQAPISEVAWDFSGQYLAIVGSGAVAVEHFQKAGKSWTHTEVMRRAMESKHLAWDPHGKHLLVDGSEGPVELRKT